MTEAGCRCPIQQSPRTSSLGKIEVFSCAIAVQNLLKEAASLRGWHIGWLPVLHDCEHVEHKATETPWKTSSYARMRKLLKHLIHRLTTLKEPMLRWPARNGASCCGFCR